MWIITWGYSWESRNFPGKAVAWRWGWGGQGAEGGRCLSFLDTFMMYRHPPPPPPPPEPNPDPRTTLWSGSKSQHGNSAFESRSPAAAVCQQLWEIFGSTVFALCFEITISRLNWFNMTRWCHQCLARSTWAVLVETIYPNNTTMQCFLDTTDGDFHKARVQKTQKRRFWRIIWIINQLYFVDRSKDFWDWCVLSLTLFCFSVKGKTLQLPVVRRGEFYPSHHFCSQRSDCKM